MSLGPSLDEKESSHGVGPGDNLILTPRVCLGFKAAWVVLLSGPVGVRWYIPTGTPGLCKVCDCEGRDLAFWIPSKKEDDCGPSLLFFSVYCPGSTWTLGLPYSPGEILPGEDGGCLLAECVRTPPHAGL